MDDKCRDRIRNWKFTQAMAYVEDVDVNDEAKNDRLVLRSLSETFGDCGWFNGHMGDIVGAAVQWLLRSRT